MFQTNKSFKIMMADVDNLFMVEEHKIFKTAISR